MRLQARSEGGKIYIDFNSAVCHVDGHTDSSPLIMASYHRRYGPSLFGSITPKAFHHRLKAHPAPSMGHVARKLGPERACTNPILFPSLVTALRVPADTRINGANAASLALSSDGVKVRAQAYVSPLRLHSHSHSPEISCLFNRTSVSLVFFSRQVTGERERCYLVGLEASGWGMGNKKGTKGSFPEARAASTGEVHQRILTFSYFFSFLASAWFEDGAARADACATRTFAGGYNWCCAKGCKAVYRPPLLS